MNTHKVCGGSLVVVSRYLYDDKSRVVVRKCRKCGQEFKETIPA